MAGEIKCQFCGREFASYQGRHSHLHRNKICAAKEWARIKGKSIPQETAPEIDWNKYPALKRLRDRAGR